MGTILRYAESLHIEVEALWLNSVQQIYRGIDLVEMASLRVKRDNTDYVPSAVAAHVLGEYGVRVASLSD